MPINIHGDSGVKLPFPSDVFVQPPPSDRTDPGWFDPPLPDVAIPEFIGLVEHSDPTKASDRDLWQAAMGRNMAIPSLGEVRALPAWATVTLILGTYAFVLGLVWIIWG